MLASISRLSAIFVTICFSSLAAAGAPSCKVEQVAVLPLGYAGGMATVIAKINGVDVVMGVDGGAQTLVTPQTVARFNLPRDRRMTMAIGTTAITVAQNVLLRNLEFAGKRYATRSVAMITLATLTPLSLTGGKAKTAPSPLAGIIGADILSEYDIDFDLAGKSMTLYKIRGCTKVTPPWTESYTPLGVKIAANHAIVMPVEIDGHKLFALLDTGATGFAISRRGAHKSGATEAMLKADPSSEIVGAGGAMSKQPTHRFKTFALGGETFRDLDVGLIGIEREGPEVLVGQIYLLFRRVWISYSTRMLYIRAPRIPPNLQPFTLAAIGFPQAAPRAYTTDPNNNCLSFDASRTCSLPPIGSIAAPAPGRAPAAQPATQQAAAKPTPEGSLPRGYTTDSNNNCLSFDKDRLCGMSLTARAAAQSSLPLAKKPEGFIGMKFVGMSQPAIRALGLQQDKLLMIFAAVPGGAADKAGLRSGDYILSYGGAPIQAAPVFADAIKAKGEGQPMELSILRGAERVTVTVTLNGPEERKRWRESLDEEPNRAERAEQLIVEETAISERFRAPGFEWDWAYSQIRLGDALRERVRGGRAANIARAIEAYLAALRTITPAIQANRWAAAHHGLGAAYRLRDAGKGGEDLELALQELEIAYSQRAAHSLNAELAATCLELGMAYAGRRSGTPAGNVDKALFYLQKAAGFYEAKSAPKKFALLNRTLGAVHLMREGVPRGEQLDSAIDAYQKALDATGQAKAPDEYAEIIKRIEVLKAEKVRAAANPG